MSEGLHSPSPTLDSSCRKLFFTWDGGPVTNNPNRVVITIAIADYGETTSDRPLSESEKYNATYNILDNVDFDHRGPTHRFDPDGNERLLGAGFLPYRGWLYINPDTNVIFSNSASQDTDLPPKLARHMDTLGNAAACRQEASWFQAILAKGYAADETPNPTIARKFGEAISLTLWRENPNQSDYDIAADDLYNGKTSLSEIIERHIKFLRAYATNLEETIDTEAVDAERREFASHTIKSLIKQLGL